MAVVNMPALSPTMTEGKLSRWLVKEGDEVRSGDVIAEIETDKAVMEVEALDDGKIGKLVIAEGTEGVAVGTAITEILGEGEASGLGEAKAAAPIEPKKESAPKADAPKESAPAPKAPPPPQQSEQRKTKPDGGRIFASPLARRIAAQNNINLATIKGTGPHGRIIRADVEGGASTGAMGGMSMQTGMLSSGERSSLQPNSSMRMVIAERLQKSWQESPHFFLDMEIALDPLLDARKALNDRAPEGVKVSVNDMLIKAAALSLIKHPEVNASWEGKNMRRHKHADIAVAVAIPDGLITPVVFDAEAKSFYAIANEVKELAGRARAGKLKPEEYNGSSFTISNLGMFGVSAFTAIINPPNSAILAIGAGAQKPVVRDGKVTVATMLTATLACDHRVVDGATGAVWLGTFRDYVENPILLGMGI